MFKFLGFIVLTLVLMLCINLSAQESETSFLEQGDQAFANFNDQAALDNYLKVIAINPNNYEANWKISRAYVEIGEDIEDDEQRASYYKKAEEYARTAIKNQSMGSDGHLYLSIALGRVALDASAKQRIKMSKEIKEEVDLAIKYNPQNDIAYHVLGRWNRKISNLSWIERGFADMFLGGVPEDASDEEAVKSFKRAIELNPGHINHHLELAITYEMMGNDELAIEALNKCLELPKTDADDDKYKAHAKEMLDDLQ